MGKFEVGVFFEKKAFVLSKGIFKQNWRAGNMPVAAGRLVYLHKVLKLCENQKLQAQKNSSKCGVECV